MNISFSAVCSAWRNIIKSSSIFTSPKITELYLYSTNFKPSIPSIPNTTLTSLNIGNLSSKGMNLIMNGGLTQLAPSEQVFVDRIVGHVISYNLEILWINESQLLKLLITKCGIDLDGVKHISKLLFVKHLNIAHGLFGSEGAKYGMQNLTDLNILYCKIGNDGLK
ncbi:hypothetical protein C9374_007309 [Naegleria lovaniensis]|uniref:Uncharacterized protein n=1 Tax=Naegleria lovaniensis TaxID=51637 RepID=A0AA88H3C4_NAELO|nr:uncharacterized protein C9374_007309 [Naegleria lovaniensis]KAG2393778.1 hypothetical protein C9374_007309 [Naegleria lovaniensis]